jgi:hypothetical protein
MDQVAEGVSEHDGVFQTHKSLLDAVGVSQASVEEASTVSTLTVGGISTGFQAPNDSALLGLAFRDVEICSVEVPQMGVWWADLEMLWVEGSVQRQSAKAGVELLVDTLGFESHTDLDNVAVVRRRAAFYHQAAAS